MQSNFLFLKKHDEELFEYAYTAEANAFIDLKVSGNNMRAALEKLVRICGAANPVLDIVLQGELVDSLSLLSDQVSLQKKGFIQRNQKAILPSTDVKKKVKVQRIKVDNTGKETKKGNISLDQYDLVRMYANSCVHVPNPDQWYLKLTYENCIKSLNSLHWILRKYYGEKASFDVNKMPIGKYEIIKSETISTDEKMTSCEQEFLAVENNSRGEAYKYQIIRIYNKGAGNIEKESENYRLMLRNQNTFEEASKYSDTQIPEGMTNFETIVPVNKTAEFYVVRYEFTGARPYKLLERINEINLVQRLRICERLCSAIDAMHHYEVPIYHRMLNPDCVYICEKRGKWTPYIVKFDFAKIAWDDIKATVIMGAKKAYEMTKEIKKKQRYLAPEWQNLGDNVTNESWRAIDIYALGVLIRDIICCSFEGDNSSKLNELVSKELSDYIGTMCNQMVRRRKTIDIAEVVECLRKEIKTKS